ncbi:unnamed protein product [Effrenium voratum]|uniref:Calcineurin-like phosphoesterase domain-containing protein n=1 Tax=Effrenium voratum TaxID=2562239 RepID=A0AA36JPQ5_9DINO|nr:unnamed protein product [Effrenium voratum]CAJ1410147.1 unnamed protein product [Effrenium voratum]
MDTDGRQAEACTAAAALIVTFLVGAACRARSSKRPRPLPFQHDEVSGFDHLDGHAPRRGLRLVVVSDTHNFHHKLKLPDGDVLIHAGDFTQYGKEEHAHDFNQWLAEQPHRTKLVVLGNHENNSDWHKRAADVLSNATLLRQSAFDLQVPGSSPVRFFGTDFFWPCLGSNPYFDQIPAGTDVVIAHGPAKGCADGGRGCPALLKAVQNLQPELVISGHVHFARGAALLSGKSRSTVLVNAANCGSGKAERVLVSGPVVIDI